MERKCDHCGARIPRLDARFCEYCGTELPRPEPVAPPAPAHVDSVTARFAAAKADPLVPELMRHTPSMGAYGAELGCGIGFAVVFLIVVGTILVSVVGSSLGRAPGIFSLVPLFMLGVGGAMLIGLIKRAASTAGAPWNRVIALVVDERTHVSSSGDNGSRTTYYVTLEAADGQREEYATAGKVSGKITAGDIGVAYLKAGRLFEFERLPC